MNQSITMGGPLTGFMNQSIFLDTPHDQPSILTEDHSLRYEDQQYFNDEGQYDHAAEGSSSLAVPYESHSQEEEAQETNPDPSELNHDDLEDEDGTGNYMNHATGHQSYFTVGVQDSSNPHAVVLDQHLGLELYSPVYALLTVSEPD